MDNKESAFSRRTFLVGSALALSSCATSKPGSLERKELGTEIKELRAFLQEYPGTLGDGFPSGTKPSILEDLRRVDNDLFVYDVVDYSKMHPLEYETAIKYVKSLRDSLEKYRTLWNKVGFSQSTKEWQDTQYQYTKYHDRVLADVECIELIFKHLEVGIKR